MEQPRQLSFPVITRVENQLGGRVPAKLSTVAAVIRNVREFDPFARLQIMNATQIDPDLYERRQNEKYRYRVMQFYALKGFRQEQKELGAAQAFVRLDRDRNGKRLLDSFGILLGEESRVDEGPRGMTSAELFERFRDSMSRQLEIAA